MKPLERNYLLKLRSNKFVFRFCPLKLVRTLSKYRVLGTSTTVILLSNDHSLCAPIYTSEECHAWYHLYGTSRPTRNTSKATK